MEKIIQFVRSKEGHATFIMVMAVVMVVLTTDYLAKEIINIKGDDWLYIAYPIAIGFAVVFELSVAFCALNAYRWVSWFLAVLGVIMVRGTLSQLTHDAMTIGWVVGWVVSGFPPLFIAFLSHRLASMNKKNDSSKVNLNTDNNNNISKLSDDNFEGFEPLINTSNNGHSFHAVKKNA